MDGQILRYCLCVNSRARENARDAGAPAAPHSGSHPRHVAKADKRNKFSRGIYRGSEDIRYSQSFSYYFEHHDAAYIGVRRTFATPRVSVTTLNIMDLMHWSHSARAGDISARALLWRSGGRWRRRCRWRHSHADLGTCTVEKVGHSSEPICLRPRPPRVFAPGHEANHEHSLWKCDSLKETKLQAAQASQRRTQSRIEIGDPNGYFQKPMALRSCTRAHEALPRCWRSVSSVSVQ